MGGMSLPGVDWPTLHTNIAILIINSVPQRETFEEAFCGHPTNIIRSESRLHRKVVIMAELRSILRDRLNE